MTGTEVVDHWQRHVIHIGIPSCYYAELIASIDAAIAAEREACAAICEVHHDTVPKYDSPELNGYRRGYEVAAKAIRARRTA